MKPKSCVLLGSMPAAAESNSAVYLADNPIPPGMVDQWFFQLTNAVPGSVAGWTNSPGQTNVFYYPGGQRQRAGAYEHKREQLPSGPRLEPHAAALKRLHSMAASREGRGPFCFRGMS
jgi:hypothetical protein